MTKNPDKALLLKFMEDPSTPTAVDSNPLAKALRCRLLAAAPSGQVRLDFEPDETFIQGNNVVQGGAVAAMLDFAMAFAGLAALPGEQGGATVSMTANYLKPVPAGRYEAVGVLERKGRTMLFASSELRAVDGDVLVANATSVLAVVP
jgi:uncharacterized protein (TIGR00369 family)